MRTEDLLSPSAVARVKQLEFFARTRVEGFLKGANRSRLKGVSPEFLHHRAYAPGDDLRHLDWRVLARTDRLVTRIFQEFTNLDVMLTLDFSGSMDYGPEPSSKMDFARHCAALLAYLFNLRNDRYGLCAWGEALGHFLPPSRGHRQLAECFRLLVTLPVRGETRLTRGAALLAPQLRRRTVVIVLSDCYEEPEGLTRALGQLALRGHEVLLYQVVHPTEQDLDFTGFTLFRDLETGQVDAADPAAIRLAYREVVAEHGQALKSGAARFGIDYRQLVVSANWDRVLAALLHERARG